MATRLEFQPSRRNLIAMRIRIEIEIEQATEGPTAPRKLSLAECLLAMPTIGGHDDLFERADDERPVPSPFD